MQSFTKEFRKQAFALNVPLVSRESLMKYVGVLHNYLHHSLLLFDPNSFTLKIGETMKKTTMQRRQ